MSSQITTQEAEKLLAKGWILKQHKNPFCQHSYYIHDTSRLGLCGSAKYINKSIATTLQKKGHKLHTDPRTTSKV